MADLWASQLSSSLTALLAASGRIYAPAGISIALFLFEATISLAFGDISARLHTLAGGRAATREPFGSVLCSVAAALIDLS